RELSAYWMGPATGMVAYAATSPRELAVVSFSGGTSSGVVASFAGDHIIVKTSRMRLAKIRPGTVRTNGINRNTPARTRSETIMTVLRLKRSTITPTNGVNSTPGAMRAVVTSAMAASG